MTDVTELEEIVVTGRRARPTFDLPDEMEVIDPDPNAPGGGGGGGFTQEEADAENRRQEDCAAGAAGGAIMDKPNSDETEWFSHIAEKDGNTVYHPPRGGTGVTIPTAAFAAALTEFGIAPQDVRGIVHNHPSRRYCDGIEEEGDEFDQSWHDRQIAFNQYPSVGDWTYATSLGNPNLRLYIVGCDGLTRGYDFSEKDILLPLVQRDNMLDGPVPALRPPLPACD